MSLTMLYTLTPSILRADAIVDLSGNYERISNFFLEENQNDKFLLYNKIKFIAQNGYSDEDLIKLDYLNSSTGIPIFSKKFAELMSKRLKNDAYLYKCSVATHTNEYEYFACKILKKEKIIDLIKSEYRSLADGRLVLKKPVFFEQENTDFFMAKDNRYTHLYAVGDKFISSIIEYGLDIYYKKL